MRNAILMAILAMISTSAIGEWIKVDRNKNAGITRYVDITTVHVREAMEDKFLSIKVLQEYDCNEVKKRILAFNTYSGNMGYGGVLYTNSKPNKWEIISSPRSVSLTLWEIACSR
jgi:hypothetical protein